MRKKWRLEDKQEAIKLRESGKTYSEIRKVINVPKSTLFQWVGRLPRAQEFKNATRIQWLAELRIKAGVFNKNKRIKWVNETKVKCQKEVELLSTSSISLKKALLAMLYWAEGGKTGSVAQFVNTDPKLMSLFINLLRQCFTLDESKFRVRLHLHYYHCAKESIDFWSNILNIPKEKFGKIYWKKRSKEKTFRKNQAGICTLRYNNVRVQVEILEFGYALGEKLAPVAQRIERVPAEDEI